MKLLLLGDRTRDDVYVFKIGTARLEGAVRRRLKTVS
jgi:hypothetical protein